MLRTLTLLALCAPLAMSCTKGSGDIIRPGDLGTSSSPEGQLQLRLEAQETAASNPWTGDDSARLVETRCGDVAGIHLAITDASGERQSCTEGWADAVVTGDFAGGTSGDHYVADCLFVGPAGGWTIDALDAIDGDDGALDCCTSTYPSDVNVTASETTEVAAHIECETAQNGALDIYTTINTPPTITDVNISPSKFADTCSEILLTVSATDPQDDGITYTWTVVTAPLGADYEKRDEGNMSHFAAATLGEYEIRVTATDELGASHWLTFPLHIVGDNGSSCDLSALCN